MLQNFSWSCSHSHIVASVPVLNGRIQQGVFIDSTFGKPILNFLGPNLKLGRRQRILPCAYNLNTAVALSKFPRNLLNRGEEPQKPVAMSCSQFRGSGSIGIACNVCS